jgi:XTP/dITP diphosphohydrolase
VRPPLLFATTNAGKLRELCALATGVKVVSPDDLPMLPLVEETEASLEGNARRKALAWAQASGLVTLADDSGLFVDALGGRPGVHSARYALGEDGARVALLLEELRNVPDERRTASFRCALCLATPSGQWQLAEGTCSGVVSRSPRGAGGFGYDPILLIRQAHRTLAEMTMEEKSRVSHRAQAFAQMRPWLVAYEEGRWP